MTGRARPLLTCAIGLAVAAATGLGSVAAQPRDAAPAALPDSAVSQLRKSLDAARGHQRHVWRDTPATNPDGTINAYIEISRGDRRKWEIDMRANARAIDRVMPEDVGGYPVNYGFVPQTVSYDGDPFDALVLGPAVEGGQVVRGIVLGLMYMVDEKGPDAKVVLSIRAPDGEPRYRLTASEQRRIGEYFARYKQHEPGAFSMVPGWGPAHEGLALVARTHAFFASCGERPGRPCVVE